jgi:hypothetical protein
LFQLNRRIGPVHLLKVNQSLGWFVHGQGRVKAQWNRLEITEVKNMEVVLKYRWITGLRSNPAEKNEPVKLADD